VSKEKAPKRASAVQMPDPKTLGKFTTTLHSFLRRLGHHRDDLTDLSQEAWAKLLEKTNEGEIINDPFAYVFTIATNLAVAAIRRSAASPIVPDPGDLLDRIGCGSRNDTYESVSSSQVALTLLRRIPTKYREVFILDRILGCNDEEIAGKTGLAIHTVRIYKTKARAIAAELEGKLK
jgi:RNA polymerase sigma factor (sigma-70 family)